MLNFCQSSPTILPARDHRLDNGGIYTLRCRDCAHETVGFAFVRQATFSALSVR